MTTDARYDCIVIGLGAMGSATLYHLAQRGIRALGIEQFQLGHAQGSSHGKTRIFRTAYADPIYARMAGEALSRWKRLESQSGQGLLELVGAIGFAGVDNEHFRHVNAVHDTLQLPYEVLTGHEASRRFKVFQLGDEVVARFAPRNGFLHADRCLKAMQKMAIQGGAEVWEDLPVQRLESQGGAVVVHAGDRRACAGGAVITAGPWLGQLAEDLAMPLEVTREQKVYFTIDDADRFRPDRLPVFAHYDTDIYGFPLQEYGLKLAMDHSGNAVDPNQVDREVDQNYIDTLKAWIERWMPTAMPRPATSAVCLYTKTPDLDFIIDHHPTMEHVVIAGGFSGHGFKFSILIGEMMADLVIDGVTKLPIERFRIARFS